MPVDIKIDKNKCVAKLENHFKGKMGLLASEILNDCNQYVKWDSGQLATSSLVHSQLEKGLLIWRTPYARRQYWAIQTAYPTYHSKATWKWCEAAKRDCLSKWTRQAQRLVDGI